jgi:hypothetical protein
MEYIENILKRARASTPNDDALVSAFKVADGEQVVGEIPAELCGLYAVFCESCAAMEAKEKEIAKEADALLSALRSKPEEEIALAVEAFRKNIYGAMNDNRTIRYMFRSSVYRVFPELIHIPDIGIREGWKVVIAEPQESGFASSLSWLFGGDISCIFSRG